MTTSNKKKEFVGAIGFWLFVPPAICFLIGWLLHEFLWDKLSVIGMAVLIHAVFTLIVIARNPNKFVSGSVLLVNLAVVLAFGYFQWQALVPATWPSWTPWIGLGLAAAAWLIIVSVLYRLGRKPQESDEESEETGHPEAGRQNVEVTERLLAALKLSSKDGDATVNVGKMLEQLAKWSKVEGQKAAAELVNSILAAVKAGVYEETDMPFVRKAIRTLQGVPEPQKAAKSEWEEEQPDQFERRSVI